MCILNFCDVLSNDELKIMEIGKEWFLGYDTVESMFSDCVTANIDKYEYITNIEE